MRVGRNSVTPVAKHRPERSFEILRFDARSVEIDAGETVHLKID